MEAVNGEACEVVKRGMRGGRRMDGMDGSKYEEGKTRETVSEDWKRQEEENGMDREA